METIIKLLTNPNLYVSLVVIIIGIIICKLMQHLTTKVTIKNKGSQKVINVKRVDTYLKMTNSITKYIVAIICILIVLQINGVNVTSMLAGLGVAGVMAGLALQDALKDIIMGFNIIMDSYFSVGDVIKVGDTEGKVTELGLKSTKLVDVNNHNVLVVANRNIAQALTLSTQLDVDIPTPYEEKLTRVDEVMGEILTKVKKQKYVKNAEYLGVNELADSAVMYRIRIWCLPEHKQQVRRETLRNVKQTYDERGIEIPYMQVDVHNR